MTDKRLITPIPFQFKIVSLSDQQSQVSLLQVGRLCQKKLLSWFVWNWHCWWRIGDVLCDRNWFRAQEHIGLSQTQQWYNMDLCISTWKRHWKVVWLVHTELALLVTNRRHFVWWKLKEELKNTSDHLRHNNGASRTFTLVSQRDVEELQHLDNWWCQLQWWILNVRASALIPAQKETQDVVLLWWRIEHTQHSHDGLWGWRIDGKNKGGWS